MIWPLKSIVRKISAWLERYHRHYEWAVHAYDSFVQELAPELVELLQRNEQVTIAVYGATQVGKTTLILNLLGLETLTTDEVANVLRGGQQLGKSATAMPIRYGCSNDDGWYINGDGPLSANLAREVLGTFRQRVESGEVYDAEILDIRIPKRLFPLQDQSNTPLTLNIIDIPGISSHNENESHMVMQLARRYVSVADLVLLVGRADSLGFLNENDLQLEALADWSKQPARFRIVLTFSFSPDSLCRLFMETELTIDSVRDVLIAEMATHDYEFPSDFRHNLYILELGDSLKALEHTNPDYCRRILDVTNQFRKKLLDTITLAVSPYARLNGAFQLDRVIYARIDRLYQELKQHQTRLDDLRIKIIKDLKKIRPDLTTVTEDILYAEIEKLHHAQKNLHQCQHELEYCIDKLDNFNWSSPFSIKVSEDLSQKVNSLKCELKRCEEAQRDSCRSLASQLLAARKVPNWCADYIPILDFQRTHLMAIESILDGYVVDSYWWSSENFNKDREHLQKALDIGAESHGHRLQSVVKTLLLEKISTLASSENDLKSQRYILNSFLSKLEKIEQERQDMCSTNSFQLEKMEDSQNIVSRFESMLNSAFLDELKKTREESRAHPSASQRFFSLLNTKLLLSEIDRMYEGRNF